MNVQSFHVSHEMIEAVWRQGGVGRKYNNLPVDVGLAILPVEFFEPGFL
jgi:hypothetical protein